MCLEVYSDAKPYATNACITITTRLRELFAMSRYLRPNNKIQRTVSPTLNNKYCVDTDRMSVFRNATHWILSSKPFTITQYLDLLSMHTICLKYTFKRRTRTSSYTERSGRRKLHKYTLRVDMCYIQVRVQQTG